MPQNTLSFRFIYIYRERERERERQRERERARETNNRIISVQLAEKDVEEKSPYIIETLRVVTEEIPDVS